MRSVSAAFKEIRNKKQITGENRILTKVELIDVGKAEEEPPFDLVSNDLLISVGNITDRIERVTLNDFAPSQISVTVHDPQDYPVFFKSDGTGKFDDMSIKYQVRVFKGITIGGTVEWGDAIFDGELRNNTISRKRRGIIEFSVIGWLKEAERYNAEEIADKNSPPFRDIAGISVDYGVPEPISGPLGARTMEFGEDQGIKWLKYDGGEKVDLEDGVDDTYILWDSIRDSCINIAVDYSELLDDGQVDFFTIIMDGANKIACYWYENIDIVDAVNLLVDRLEEGIPGSITRDIDVEEVVGAIEKNFIYLPPIIPNVTDDLKITCCKVVDTDGGNIITVLVGTEWKTGDLNKLYKVVIDRADPTNYTAELISTGVDRFCRFVYFGGRTWVVCGEQVPTANTWLSLERWRGVYLRRLSADWTIFDENKTIAFSTWGFHLTYSFSPKYGTDEVYCLYTELTGAPLHWKFGLRKYKYSTDTWSDVKYPLRIDSFPDDHGVFAIQNDPTEKQFFYYGTESESTPGIHQGRRYDITHDIDELLWANSSGDPIDTIINYTWERKDGSYDKRVFSKFKKAIDPSIFNYVNIWIKPDGTCLTHNEGIINKTRYMDTNNRWKGKYSAWYCESGRCYIKSFSSYDGSSEQESKKLLIGYKPDIVAPKIYRISAGEFSFVGFITDNYTIVPFLYEFQMLPTVRKLDLTDQTVRSGLSDLAVGYLDIIARPTMTKVVFRFREKFRDTDTLDQDQYIDTPVVKVWKHFYDGIIVKNSRDGLFTRRGNTGFDAKILTIDNIFISEGTIEQVADWYYNFYNSIRKLILVERDMYVEPELMDKITITLRKLSGGVMWNLETMVIEASFVPSRKRKDFYRMKLQLLEIGGVEYRQHILEEVGEKMVV